jgi:hypothetical protein
MDRRNSTPVITTGSVAAGGVPFAPGLEILGMEILKYRGFSISGRSVYDTHGAAAAKLLDARDEVAVWLDIIAFRFHHYHEITLAFHVK